MTSAPFQGKEMGIMAEKHVCEAQKCVEQCRNKGAEALNPSRMDRGCL
jgi:hypothetical protein